MIDFHKLTSRYKQFGGTRLVWQYSKLGVLPVVVKEFFRCLYKRQSFKAIYPEVLKIVEPFLTERFQVLCKAKRKRRASDFKILANELPHEHPKIIWFCWLQGLEKAPNIVKACHRSLKRNLIDYEIRIIDSENWIQFVQIPDYIVERWDKNQIPPALFSDILRLQLLIEHGGSWIDSTVLCTGSEHTKDYLDADFFVFQYTRPGEPWSGNISNWFISAHSNNVVLMTLRDMLFAYWKEYNCTLDYYIFHLFFAMVANEFPEEIAAMPYGYSMRSLTLLHHWDETFDQKKWDKLISRVSFHKLAFRVDQITKENENNFYNYILNTNKEIENGRI